MESVNQGNPGLQAAIVLIKAVARQQDKIDILCNRGVNHSLKGCDRRRLNHSAKLIGTLTDTRHLGIETEIGCVDKSDRFKRQGRLLSAGGGYVKFCQNPLLAHNTLCI